MWRIRICPVLFSVVQTQAPPRPFCPIKFVVCTNHRVPMRNVQLLSSGLRWSSTATSLSAKSFQKYERFMQELMKVMTEGRSEGAKLFFVVVLVHGRRRMVTESDVDGDYDEVKFLFLQSFVSHGSAQRSVTRTCYGCLQRSTRSTHTHAPCARASCCTGRQQNLTQRNVRQRLSSNRSMILKVTNVCKFTSADEMWNLRFEWTGHRSREKMTVIPHLWNSKMLRCRWTDLASPRLCNVDPTLWAKMKNVLVCNTELRAKEARNTICKMCWNLRPRRRPAWSPRAVRSLFAHHSFLTCGKRSRRQFQL